MSSHAHVPVLLGPVLEGLNINEGGCYVDGTFGRGGHSAEILRRLNERGRLLAIDRDPEAVASAPPELTSDQRFELIRGDFAELGTILRERDLQGTVDGILLDLGVSSPQLDTAERGFSFMRDGPLDMRMDPDAGISAAEWLAQADYETLKKALKTYGEERDAARIARAIQSARSKEPVTRTVQLAAIVEGAVRTRPRKIHPATKTFQALRIVVNRELERLENALIQSLDALANRGRLCVITFHSLEDRIVKRFMRNASREAEEYRGLPDVPDEFRPRLRLVGKAIAASAEEIVANPRARSARLRVAERL